MYQQQGDVLIKLTTVPAGAKTRFGNVLSEGEATGHSHRVEPVARASVELLELGERLFLRILGGDARVVHEEHEAQTIPAGEYEIGRVLEFDHFQEQARFVAD